MIGWLRRQVVPTTSADLLVYSPHSLLSQLQTIRVVAVQSSNMVAYYLQDQLQADFAREEQIKDGKITAKMADEQQEEWEQVRTLY